MNKIHKILRVPPLLFFSPVIIGGILELFFIRNINISSGLFLNFGITIIVISISIMTLALIEFYKNSESPSPFKKTNKILSKGIFRYSRNPMYLSFFIFTSGISISLNSFGIILGSLIGIYLINLRIVSYEENKLSKIAGYKEYKKKTRRWI